MKATGIVRRIDDLGRVVIPKEIRRTLRIREGDPLEIFTDREGEIILKKYSPIGELSAFARQYADSLAQAAGYLVCICDMDQIVAAAGTGRREFQEKYIDPALEKALEGRKDIVAAEGEKKFVRVTGEKDDGCTQQVICPILCEGDVIGGVMILGREEKGRLGETEHKLASCAAGFLGRQMEQ
ncbi:stage V sporulation protein T [Mordavella massiliensis]|uniref:Stage V sporulation protein T n=1 Tax=Mordavella massiliensis TaxID=1871024 RepID=A0A939BHD5_9CLOT|nr:stage V sporulation protein T [Mordavella massiliensis]MBM6948671.1 stage V sporulation protein T [Mordavella massiliensis]